MQAREGFNNLRAAEAASDEAVKGIAHAEEVAKLLRHNIVQGQKIEGKDALRWLRHMV
jgi:complex III assembly factor LYRM7